MRGERNGSHPQTPDVLGRELSVAREMLESNGCTVSVTETRSPQVPIPRESERWRVVRQRRVADRVHLTVVREGG